MKSFPRVWHFALLLLPLALRRAGAFAPVPPSVVAPTANRRGAGAAVVRLRARPETRFREVHKNLLKRRTINEFEPTLPPHWEKAVERAIEAAIYAPNHRRTEPWRFYLLGPESVEKVCRLNAEIVAAKKGSEAGEKKLQRWLKMPGWLVVTCAKNGGGDGDGESATMLDPMSPAREDYAACCCAVQNLCLSLSVQGMGTKWTTGGVNFDERFAEAVGFDAGEEYTVGTIWFGTPAKVPSAPVKRRGIDDILKRVE